MSRVARPAPGNDVTYGAVSPLWIPTRRFFHLSEEGFPHEGSRYPVNMSKHGRAKRKQIYQGTTCGVIFNATFIG